MNVRMGFLAALAVMAIAVGSEAQQAPPSAAGTATASHCAAIAWSRHDRAHETMVVDARWRDLMAAAGGACIGADLGQVMAIACRNNWLVGNACQPAPAPIVLSPAPHVYSAPRAPRRPDPCAAPTPCTDHPPVAAPPPPSPPATTPDGGVTRTGMRYHVRHGRGRDVVTNAP